MRKGQMSWLGLLLIVVNVVIVMCVLMMGIADADTTVEPHTSNGLWKQELRDKYPDGLPWATVNATQVNFREGPGKEYRVVEQWSRGVGVEVLGQQDGWYQVLHWTQPEPMWVWGEYLDFV